VTNYIAQLHEKALRFIIMYIFKYFRKKLSLSLFKITYNYYQL